MSEIIRPVRVVLADNYSDLPSTGSIFGQKKWMEVLNTGLPGQIHIIKVYEEQNLKAYLPVYIVKKGWLKKAYLPPMTPYGGPYFTDVLPQAENNQFHKIKTGQRKWYKYILDFLEKEFDYSYHRPEDPDVRQAQWNGWDTGAHYMLSFDLKGYNPEKKLSKRTLLDVKAADKAGLIFMKSDEDEFFCDGFNRIFDRKKRPVPYEAKQVLAMRKKATELDLFENFVVKNKSGEPLVYYSTLPCPEINKVICWTISTLKAAEHCDASTYMYYKLMEFYASRYEYIELGGADNEGVANFKEKFSSELICYNSIELYRTMLTKILLQGYYHLRSSLR